MTADVLAALLKACAGERLGRRLRPSPAASLRLRRSEVSGSRAENIVFEDPVPGKPGKPDGDALPYTRIHLGRTKTTEVEDHAFVLPVGRPVLALQVCLERAGITVGGGGVSRYRPLWQSRAPRPHPAGQT